ncbi:MAG: Asp-tRNA(Asn)/Glu-tRNA(Gln) amidotransferase subunit GatC [Candidatus Moranbacteria bacterium]|jgi:aspartyl-tRNA(Asn)/glutamyl-tRNA(Gln) amidotransferase subunit C|nr:Asp-tRNA(Asn)/Glu-tRNA(Gln) amidotransferase subunit GatC [Candidatus Moranbacteria bacterium]
MLSVDEVKHIALLGRIGLTDEEVPQYQKDLSAVLDFFQELEKLPTETLEPIGHITGRTDVMREDEQESFPKEDCQTILKNAPDTKDGFLKVKSVF